MPSLVSRLGLFSVSSILALGCASLARAQIPYPNAGTPNSATYTFTATATGDVIGYFAGSGASYDEQVALYDNGVLESNGYGLDDRTSATGQSFDFGPVTAGDTLVFADMVDNFVDGVTAPVFSDPALNASYDQQNGGVLGVNISTEQHVYSVAASANEAYNGSPAGVYVGFEDEAFPDSDYNYFDDTFVFTDVSVATTSVPDSGSSLLLALIGAGMLLAARRFKARGC